MGTKQLIVAEMIVLVLKKVINIVALRIHLNQSLTHPVFEADLTMYIAVIDLYLRAAVHREHDVVVAPGSEKDLSINSTIRIGLPWHPSTNNLPRYYDLTWKEAAPAFGYIWEQRSSHPSLDDALHFAPLHWIDPLLFATSVFLLHFDI